jgi:tRNA threonylcarbamoyladenosine biosynthesis protein TsaE
MTNSEAETSAFGRLLGEKTERPLTILLQGELGAGKSVIARALARGLGIAEDVPITSPTFTLMNHYPARIDLYHFDLYRLVDAEELIEIGFDDFAHSDGVALVEWPERLQDREFDHLLLRIERLSADSRRIEVSAFGSEPQRLLDSLREWLAAQ